MKLITRDTDYAVRALCVIARNKNKTMDVNILVKKTSVPKPFLRKILQKLNKKGLLESYRGKGGGFQLNRTSGSIPLMELIKIFQGPVVLSEHLFKKKPCPKLNACCLKKKIDKIQNHLIEELKSITIASLLNKKEA